MKILSLKVSALALACLPTAFAWAADLTGSVSNETTATAEVTFNMPLTITNTLTPVMNQVAGPSDKMVNIATGQAGIDQPGVTAQLAMKELLPGNLPLIAYAGGHDGDPDYSITYMMFPAGTDPNSKADLPGYSRLISSTGSYLVSDNAIQNVNYNVWAMSNGSLGIAPGVYTINTTVGVYNP